MRQVRWWKTSLGAEEIASLSEAILAGHVSQGPVTVEFEKELARRVGAHHAVATTSGSVALLMGLWANGIGPGDEVIVPNRTFAATAHAALMLGAKVVLVDTIPENPIIDAKRIEAKITARTRAIMPVHLNGRAAPMQEIRAIAAKHDLKIIEDAAQALFSRNAAGCLGTQSDAGCYSLGMSKLLQTGQGGMVVTQDAQVAGRLHLIRNHGAGGDSFSASYDRLGCNFKYTDIQAAIGLVQLQRMDERLAHLTAIYERYRDGIADFSFIRIMPVDIAAGELPLYVEVLCQPRAQVMAFLETRGVDSRKSLPSLHVSPHLGPQTGTFPHSRIFEEQAMYLPCGPGQSMADIDHVLEALSDYARKSRSEAA